MFGFFKSNKKNIITKDFIWKNEAIKYNALLKHLSQHKKTILVYYFEDTKKDVEEVINAANLNYNTDANSFASKIWLMNASALLHKSDIDNRVVFFAEHHPSFNREKEIKQHLLEKLGVQEIIFYTSFEDKLMKIFGSERILQLMEKMGLKDDESLEHPYINSSLERAQQRIDENLALQNNTRMRKDWFELNFPNTEKL